MNKAIAENNIVSIEQLTAVHGTIADHIDPNDLDLKLEGADPNALSALEKRSLSIYLLLRDDYPVYVGKTLSARERAKQHLKDKEFDQIWVFTLNKSVDEPQVLKYIEFLCYYALWSRNYCLIYNGTNVWNTLPLVSQKNGPMMTSHDVGVAHAFANRFVYTLGEIGLIPPDQPKNPLRLEYVGRKRVTLNATYWRPPIPKELHHVAIDYWDKKEQERRVRLSSGRDRRLRCMFAGAGSFTLHEGTIGQVMRNDQAQQFTYDLLKRMDVFRESYGRTLWGKPHPFPKSNLMLHVVQGCNSPNARRELVVEGTQRIVSGLETDWRTNPSL